MLETDQKSANMTIVERFFDLLEQNKLDEFHQLWHDDVVFEMPYTAPGLKERYVGKPSVVRFFNIFRNSLDKALFNLITIQENHRLNHFIIEGTSDCLTNDGKPYRNRYVWAIKLKEDKVKLFREYSNPLIIQAVFGGETALEKIF